jgi:hypothetical protein
MANPNPLLQFVVLLIRKVDEVAALPHSSQAVLSFTSLDVTCFDMMWLDVAERGRTELG